MTDVVETLAQLSVLVFVIASMFSLGLALTIPQILDPLKNTRLVILAIIANFILVPAAALLIAWIIPLDEPVEIGLILLAAAAGAPFLPKLAEAAKGNIAFSVGLMVLLMLVTIIYLPLVIPLFLESVDVNPLEIARSLIVLMLIPLAVGLLIKARYNETAAKVQPTFAMAANISLLTLAVLGLVLNFSQMIDLIGSLGILAGFLFIVASGVVGFLLGGADSGTKSVLALGTAQRNLSAALVVASQNFSSDVITYIMVIGIIGLVVLMPAAGELGRRFKSLDSESVHEAS